MTAKTRIVSAPVLGIVLGMTLSACSDPIDLDLRGKIGGSVDTSAAAQKATENRPKPDDRGIISYPNYQVAVAKRGDTLSSLSNRIGLPASELAKYNGMKIDDPLRKGELVALPRRVTEPSAATGAEIAGPIKPAASVDVATLAGGAIDRASPTTPAPAGTSGVEPVRHKVARGETAFTIARLYDVSPRSLAEWNGLDKSFAVREGQFLLIPVVQKTAAVPTPKPREIPEPGTGSPTPTPPSASKPLPDETPPPASAAKAATAGAAAATAAAPKPKPVKPVADVGQAAAPKSQMVMPVSGSIIRDYAKGRNEGIDISASAGSPVKAAASGKVASISTTAEGVKFLLVRHPGDLITVYTHLDSITVKKGDAVSRGQSIGKVRAGEPPFLHFEVRKGFESTDPMAYLP
ncbi:peptidoglycan DD-metalloendopeptidase family protein [uncultured Pelagimonas sp.]|uniref:peptidoglycan DD-metalloendopeptidase family protein n=1 Tax=uncultured Pelagimonas sp. TaxID=1618102 RepID=UPI00261D438C|nr:peptidoglycan DD-metalloendopeptidase family protein [uncultured Pelagimonas sp.]